MDPNDIGFGRIGGKMGDPSLFIDFINISINSSGRPHEFGTFDSQSR